ncbi:MAG: polysaccharide deacetylase family protein [Magnetococcales bacterium]|nr:polysaccharide deacetylase family protein [Magnetococcales bacterium]
MLEDQWYWLGVQEAMESVKPITLRAPWWLRLGQKQCLPVERFLAPPPGVYILVYHSVVDPDHRQEWERHYRKGEVSVQRFARQLDILSDMMTPLPLSAVPGLWERGGPDRPYFVVTFDDGLSNNLRLAHPLVRERGICPTVFVCGDYARGEVFYRILASILVHTGWAEALAQALQQVMPEILWSRDPETLFIQTKRYYRIDFMEQAVERVFTTYVGPVEDLKAHMTVEEVRQLSREGWEIANHTLAHRILSAMNLENVTRAIQENIEFWQRAQISLTPFLAYPVGRACDVGPNVQQFMRASPGLHGIYAGGGVNLHPSHAEWLRFSLGMAETREQILEALRVEVARTRAAFVRINGGQ